MSNSDLIAFELLKAKDGSSLGHPSHSPKSPLRQFVVQQERDRSSMEARDRDAYTDQLSGEHIDNLNPPQMRSKLGHASSGAQLEDEGPSLLGKAHPQGPESEQDGDRGAENASFLSHSNLFP